MNRNRIFTVTLMSLLAISLVATTACKSGGMALTSRGQLLKLNIEHPKDLPDNGEDNLDINISNRGANNVTNVLLDVELPSQLVVLDQTNERGIQVTRDPSSNVYHFAFENIQPTESSRIRFKVRTAFGTMRETGTVKVTAWQRDLPGDRLVETAVIKLRN